MKKDVSEYMAKCPTYQYIKAKHQIPLGLLQPLSVSEQKWKHVSMDFIVRLQSEYNALWLIVEKVDQNNALSAYSYRTVKEVICLRDRQVTCVPKTTI